MHYCEAERSLSARRKRKRNSDPSGAAAPFCGAPSVPCSEFQYRVFRASARRVPSGVESEAPRRSAPATSKRRGILTARGWTKCRFHSRVRDRATRAGSAPHTVRSPWVIGLNLTGACVEPPRGPPPFVDGPPRAPVSTWGLAVYSAPSRKAAPARTTPRDLSPVDKSRPG